MALSAPPPGFFSANHVLNQLPVPLVSEMVKETLRVMWLNAGAAQAEQYYRAQQDLKVELKQLQSALNALAYVFQEALLHGLSHAQLPEILQAHADLSEAVRAELTTAWSMHSDNGRLRMGDADSQQPPAAEDLEAAALTTQKALRLGRLVEVDWKLGVRISSNDCQNLGTPFVALTLQIADAGGRVRAVPLQLSLGEFRSLGGVFQDVAIQLDQA